MGSKLDIFFIDIRAPVRARVRKTVFGALRAPVRARVL